MKKKPLSGLRPSDLVLRAGGGRGPAASAAGPARHRTSAPSRGWTLTIRVVNSYEGKAKVPISLIAALIARTVGSTGLPGASPGDRGTGGSSTASGLRDAEGSSAAASEGSEGGASD